ncbi:MAG TPA: GNAT family N-acetyltransferase [Sedimentisphaerales bacterium]|nr:GNAT family N-acetyltransferase [Sedimentisphaerales bacterium]
MAILPANNIKQIKFYTICSPTTAKDAQQIQSFLLDIFEYGDYNFRSALLGKFSPSLKTVYYLAKYKNAIIAVAGALYSRKSGFFAFVGPVCVAETYRHLGIGRKIVALLLDHLKSNNCCAAYLGVKPNNPASCFYRQLGFDNYTGIVMRKLFVPQEEIEKKFQSPALLKIQPLQWHHWPAVMALFAWPAKLYTADFQNNIFSSRYFPVEKFAPVFGTLMTSIQKNKGFANILISDTEDVITGCCHITPNVSSFCKHIAVSDFYFHDNCLNKAQLLLNATIEKAKNTDIKKIYFYCLACDYEKRKIIESLNGSLEAVLPGNVNINQSFVDLLIYRLLV